MVGLTLIRVEAEHRDEDKGEDRERELGGAPLKRDRQTLCRNSSVEIRSRVTTKRSTSVFTVAKAFSPRVSIDVRVILSSRTRNPQSPAGRGFPIGGDVGVEPQTSYMRSRPSSIGEGRRPYVWHSRTERNRFVKRRQGYRFRLLLTVKPKMSCLRRFVGCSRFVWNELLAQNEIRLERGEKKLGYGAMCEYLAYLKSEYAFLRNVHSQPLQQTLKDLAVGYSRAFNLKLPARRPRFKKKGRPQGIRFPQGFTIDGSCIYLPKVGWVGFRRSRHIEGTPKNVTVSSDGKHWYVAILTEREVNGPVHAATSSVGIDLGVARFAALSDGTFVDGANAFKACEKRLAFYQRRMQRKELFSANWRKAKAHVSRVQRKIVNVRRDMLHKASTTISKNHAVVVLEDLRVLNLTASASGTVRDPGRNVRAKSGLNRRILDQGWGEFRRQLTYKLAWSGGSLLLVDPRDTSRKCSRCGHVDEANRPTQTSFRCVVCDYTANADSNAAVNVLAKGRTGPDRLWRFADWRIVESGSSTCLMRDALKYPRPQTGEHVKCEASLFSGSISYRAGVPRVVSLGLLRPCDSNRNRS